MFDKGLPLLLCHRLAEPLPSSDPDSLECFGLRRYTSDGDNRALRFRGLLYGSLLGLLALIKSADNRF